MSRGILPISVVSRDGHEEETSDKLSPWLSALVNRTIKQETAVEQSRKRQSSIVNQVNNVIRNPNRYATVDDAVKDMRQRTGLEDYLQKIKQAEVGAQKKRAFQIVAYINSNKEVPQILKKYQNCEDIVNYINNSINNKHGLGVSIASTQDDILRFFGPKCGITAQDVYDESVMQYISDVIFEAKAKLGPSVSDPNIGTGVGKEEENDNDDMFSLCMPKEGV